MISWSTICAVIVIIIATIIIQYLLNPSWHRLGVPPKKEKREKTEEEKKKEEEFYREIWNAKKR